MTLDFSLFSDEPFPKDKAITNRSGIEPCDIDDFFRGRPVSKEWPRTPYDIADSARRTRFGTSLKDIRENYPGDESACLSFMTPEAFAFFLPLFMKFAVLEYDEAKNIPESIAYKLHSLATCGARNEKTEAIIKKYSPFQYTDEQDKKFYSELEKIESARMQEILNTYSKDQLNVIIETLDELSRIWGPLDSAESMEAAELLRKKFGLPEHKEK